MSNIRVTSRMIARRLTSPWRNQRPPWLGSQGDSAVAMLLEASWAEGWLVIFKLRKLNGKVANLNSCDLLRSFPAPRCYQRTLHMHIHMHTLLYKNVYTDV